MHSAKFKRVVCPSELTAKTGCVRNDEDILAGKRTASAARSSFPSTAAASAAGIVAAATVLMGLASA